MTCCDAVDNRLFNVTFEFEYSESSHAGQLSDTILNLVTAVAIGVEVRSIELTRLTIVSMDMQCVFSSFVCCLLACLLF